MYIPSTGSAIVDILVLILVVVLLIWAIVYIIKRLP